MTARFQNDFVVVKRVQTLPINDIVIQRLKGCNNKVKIGLEKRPGKLLCVELTNSKPNKDLHHIAF